MSQAASVRTPPPDPLAQVAQLLVLRVCTANPFYVISAGLFLAGLYITFEAKDSQIETWALMSGLAGYTLLLAATAFLLVRFAQAWDDLRTVLLLVVLMFLATSVTFDEVLILDPARGIACNLMGLAFAIAVSEGLLRGIRLRLPTGFRVPYYLILGLFFLYPLAVSALVNPNVANGHLRHGGQSEWLLWALFAFAPLAGLVSLTLLPAIRRGAGYVLGNGSPWSWPLYPWTLFGLLALAVPARSYLLCYSMHLLVAADRDSSIFGPYFVVPFGLIVAVLLVEIGVSSASPGVLRVALALPALLAVVAMMGHRSDLIYREFLETFTARLGGTPAFLTVLAAVGFYTYAALRRIQFAAGYLTAALLALAVVGPNTLDPRGLTEPSVIPLLAAAGLQLGLGITRRNAWHCLLGSVALASALTLAVPGEQIIVPWRGAVAFHLVLAAVLMLGYIFRNEVGYFLRDLGALLVFLACLVVSVGGFVSHASPPWWVVAYPPIMAALLASYGWLLHHHPASYACAALVLLAWGATAGWRLYLVVRQLVVGMDQIALSLAAFTVAVLISLGKSGYLSRRLVALGWLAPPADESTGPVPPAPAGAAPLAGESPPF